jgi:hypothetical protein
MNLQSKAIDIKGKKYVLVSDRVIAFNEEYKNGSIITELKSAPDASMVIVKAKVTPDCANPDRYFTAYSQATWGEGMVNKTAALENCETSAVGRALGMMGIGVIDSIASADEVVKATTQPAYKPQNAVDTELTTECRLHGEPMYQKISQKTGNPYWSHKMPNGDLCFGKDLPPRANIQPSEVN